MLPQRFYPNTMKNLFNDRDGFISFQMIIFIGFLHQCATVLAVLNLADNSMAFRKLAEKFKLEVNINILKLLLKNSKIIDFGLL